MVYSEWSTNFIDRYRRLPTGQETFDAGVSLARKDLLDCLEDEAICCWVLNKTNEGNIKKLIQDIISWNVMVALDPRVSSDAVKLIEQGRNERI